MAFPTAAQILTYASAVLKVAEADLPTLWTTISTQAAAAGQADCVSAMTMRGYSASQVIDDWDYSFTYGLSQGLYRVGTLGGGYGEYDTKWFEQFDLCDIKGGGKSGFLNNQGVVISSGVVIAPDIDSPVGGVGYGGVGGSSAVRVAQQAFDCIPYRVGGCNRRGYC